MVDRIKSHDPLYARWSMSYQWGGWGGFTKVTHHNNNNNINRQNNIEGSATDMQTKKDTHTQAVFAGRQLDVLPSLLVTFSVISVIAANILLSRLHLTRKIRQNVFKGFFFLSWKVLKKTEWLQG